MNPESHVDLNQVAANLAIESVKQISANFMLQLKRAWQRHGAFSGELFQLYAENSLSFYRSVRTVIHRSAPTDLISVYGHLRLRRHDVIVTDDEFLSRAGTYRCCVVTGTAGSGKSFLFRYLFCRMFEQPNAQIPVLVELRRVKTTEGLSVSRLVNDAISAFGLKLDEKLLADLLSTGRFAIFFDGLDELAPKVRRAFEDALMDFLKTARNNLVVVSSRPDQRFHGWPLFSEYKIERLRPQDAAGIVKKLNIDEVLKRNFLNAIEQGSLRDKDELLGIPLFVYILVLVFRDFAEVPGKIVLFYRFAFDVLYSKHDALKPGFERHRYTDLSIDDMERVVGCFCCLSYIRERYEFTDVELARLIKETIDLEDVAVDADDLQKDLLECLCLLQRDGMGVTFTHRTFQEYFCAHYVVSSPVVDMTAALDECLLRIGQQVTEMALSLAQSKVESEWILPKLREFVQSHRGMLDSNAEFFQQTHLMVRVKDGAVSLQHSSPSHLYEISLLFDEIGDLKGDIQTITGISPDEFRRRAHNSMLIPSNLRGSSESRRQELWEKGKGSSSFKLEGEDAEWAEAVGLGQAVLEYRKRIAAVVLKFEEKGARLKATQDKVMRLIKNKGE